MARISRRAVCTILVLVIVAGIGLCAVLHDGVKYVMTRTSTEAVAEPMTTAEKMDAMQEQIRSLEDAVVGG